MGGTILDHVEQFLTGKCHSQDRERVLATVLFADIVGSTERAIALGDHSWRELLAAFHARVQEMLRNFSGREVNTAGTLSLRLLTARHEPSAARVRSARPCVRSTSKSAADCIPGNARS
jgi:class 3 adenylate cyclase